MRSSCVYRVAMNSISFILLLTALVHSHAGVLVTAAHNSTRSAQRLQFHAEPVNSTSLYVEWLSSFSSSSSSVNDVDCPVRRYVVRVRDALSSSRPRSWRYDPSETSAVVTGLRAGSVQRVRLVADDSCRRRGRMSRWVSVQLPAATVSTPGRITKSVRDLHTRDTTFQILPGQPTSVRTRVIQPDTILVSWQPPLDGGAVTGYMIGYGEGVPDVNWRYLERHRRNITIRNLKPSTQYVVSVRAFNDVDKGPVIYDLVYTASAQENSEVAMVGPAPSSLRARPRSSTSVSLHWHDASLGRTRRIVDNRYYNIHYEATRPGAGKTMSVIVKDLSVVLHDLEPATRYEFKVRTVKDGLTSPFSNVVTAWTLEENAAATTSSTLSRREHHRAGGKARYRQTTGDDNKVAVDTRDTSDWMRRSTLMRDQHTSTDSVKVRREPASISMMSAAQNVDVSSNTTTATDRQPEVKFGTVVLHRVSVYITWPREAGCSASDSPDVVGYRLRYQAVDNANEFISRQLTDNFVLLENVQSGVRYRFQVKYVFADESETGWSEDGLVDTTPPQRQTVTN